MSRTEYFLSSAFYAAFGFALVIVFVVVPLVDELAKKLTSNTTAHQR